MKTKNTRFQGLVAAGLTLACLPATGADQVTDWNLTAENAVKTAALNPGIQGRFPAIVHTAIYDAVNGIVGKYTPCFGGRLPPPARNGSRTVNEG